MANPDSESDSGRIRLRPSEPDPTNERTNERTERMVTDLSRLKAERAPAYRGSAHVSVESESPAASRSDEHARKPTYDASRPRLPRAGEA